MRIVNATLLSKNISSLFENTTFHFLKPSIFFPQGIISDLFPGVVLPKPDYDLFIEALKENIAKLNLQPVPWFIEKIIQVTDSA